MQTMTKQADPNPLLTCLVSSAEFRESLATYQAHFKQLETAKKAAIDAMLYLESMQIEVLSFDINRRVPQLFLAYSAECESLKAKFNGFKLIGAENENEQWCMEIFGCFVYFRGEKA